MNYLFYNPSARNGKAAEDLQLIKKTLDGQDVEIYAVTDIDDYVSVIDKIQPEDIVYIVGHIIRYNEVQKTCETTPQDADTKQDQNPCSCTLMFL